MREGGKAARGQFLNLRADDRVCGTSGAAVSLPAAETIPGTDCHEWELAWFIILEAAESRDEVLGLCHPMVED